MKQILCVVDFSEATENVLEVAAEMANARKAHVIILFPYRLIDYNHEGAMASLKIKLESEAKEKFETVRNKLQALKKASCEFHPEIGFLSGRIGAYLSKNNIDSVIIGEQQVKDSSNKNSSDLQSLITASTVPFTMVPTKINGHDASIEGFKNNFKLSI